MYTRRRTHIVSAYYYICVLILLYMCPCTTMYVSSYTTIYGSSYIENLKRIAAAGRRRRLSYIYIYIHIYIYKPELFLLSLDDHRTVLF